MRHLMIVALYLSAFPASLHAHSLPACDPVAITELRKVDGEERYRHQKPDGLSNTLIYDFDTHSGDWVFHLRFVIDEGGRISCISPGSAYESAPPQITPQRQSALDAMAERRFEPFLIDGKPAAVYAETWFYEEEKPGPHVPRPLGDIATTEIRLTWSSRGNPPPFDMTIKGDGTVTYQPRSSNDLFGEQTYSIPPERVAAMLNLAEAAQFWSLRDVYHHDSESHGWAYSKVEIALGDNRKAVANDGSGGIPTAAADLIYAMSALADVDQWQKIDQKTLATVARNGFDFTSEKGAKLLIALVSDPDTPDDVISDAISRGAPQDRVVTGYPFDFSFVDAAIAGQRFDLANRLIDQGALTLNGQVDKVAVTRALSHAVQSGSPALVQRLLALGPDLVIRRNDATKKTDPIMTFVRRPENGQPADTIAIIQLLLDHGADINSRDTFRHSVMDKAIAQGEVDVIVWLLGKGAQIQDDQGISPLYRLYDEDIALILLNAGADLSDQDVVDKLVSNARYDHWTRVAAWLKAHGKWPD